MGAMGAPEIRIIGERVALLLTLGAVVERAWHRERPAPVVQVAAGRLGRLPRKPLERLAPQILEAAAGRLRQHRAVQFHQEAPEVQELLLSVGLLRRKLWRISQK